jgi:hypothetical protein
MNGNRALRVIAYVSLSIGVGILTRGAWGFVIFGVLVLIDTFIIPSHEPPPPQRAVAESETTEP